MAQYSIQKVPKVVGRDIVTGEPKVTLRQLKDLTFTNGSESVPLTVDGVPLLHFEHSKTFGMSGSNSTIDDFLMSLQLGTGVEVLSSTTEIKILETIKTTVVDEATTEYTPTGTAGSEILWVEVLDTNNQTTETFEQAAVLATGKFTVSGKTLTFNAGELAVGSTIQISYYPTASSARKIQNIASNYVTSLEWDIHCRFKEACTKQEKLGYIHLPSGFLMGNFEWATAETSDPATHNFELSAEKQCSDDELYTVYWYDEDDLV